MRRALAWGIATAVLSAMACVGQPAGKAGAALAQRPAGASRPGAYVNPKDGSEMILVAAGTFKMGSNAGLPNEKPAHDVRVGSFHIGKHEVTNRQFKQFVAANPQWARGRVDKKLIEHNYLKHWPGETYPPAEADHPVVYVSWLAAKAYCEWAAGRLPTEAEWEYACRAGSTAKYCFGDSVTQLGDYAWHRGSSGRSTHPVGQKKPNDWGIHDMHGSVYEWCSSMHKAYPYGADDGREAYKDTFAYRVLLHRVMRGGSWSIPGEQCRSAYRARCSPTGCGHDVGFRVASSASTPSERPKPERKAPKRKPDRQAQPTSASAPSERPKPGKRAPRPKPDRPAQLRFDGVYQDEAGSRTDGWGYCRFYEDGTVIAVTSTGSPSQVARWFSKEHGHVSRGRYRVKGRRLTFSATSGSGTVDYTGEIQGDKLTLNVHSHINGNRSRRAYRFVKADVR